MADNYRVGVSIALTNGVSPILAIIGRDMLGLRTSIRAIEGNFGGWARAIGAVGGILAGGAILKGLMSIANASKELLDQQVQLKNLGLEQNDILKLTADYYKNVAKVIPTASASEYLQTVKELRAVTGAGPGGLEEAARLAPKAMMVDALMSNTFKGETGTGEYYKLLRSEEMKGIATDDTKREQFTDQMFSYIMAFGGKLKTDDIVQLARRGGTSFINMKPEAMGATAVLAADLGGSATGTAAMTLQQLQLGANTLSKQQAEQLSAMGLLDMSKAKATGFGGGRLQLQPGAMVGSLEHAGDIPGWVRDVVWPALQKASGGDRAVLESLLSKIAPNRNAQKMIQMYGDDGFADQIKKDLGLAGQVLPIQESYKNFIKDNPKGVEQGYDEQYKSMMEAIGAPVMQAAIPVMRAVTDFFSAIGAFANSNPEAIKVLAYGVGTLAAALIAVPVGAALVWAGIPASLIAIAAAFGTLAAVNFSAVKNGLMTINDALSGLIGWLNSNSISDAIGKWFTMPGDHPHPGRDGLKHNESLRSFDGGSGAKVTPISLSLNVDGRTLAQSISQQMDYLYEHATGAPSYDGNRKFIPSDGGIIGG